MRIEELEAKAKQIRRATLELCANTGEGRLASSLSAIDIYVALYYGGILGPEDRFVLSKGHGLAGLYPILQDLGRVSREEVDAICTPGGRFGAYGDDVPTVAGAWGSVGHGLGYAAGLALAARLQGKRHRVFVVIGDGECYEGSTWEAAAFAAHHGLNNLVCVLDRNGGMTIDFTERALRLEPLQAKWDAFGWQTIPVDGHHMQNLHLALRDAVKLADTRWHGPAAECPLQPILVLAKTVKGKGVKELEGNPMGHVITPQGAALEQARRDLA